MTVEAAQRISIACRILGAQQQGDSFLGHVSVRTSDGTGFWIKAAGYGLEEVTAERVICLDLAGTIIDGQGRRHNEWPLHAEIYRLRSDVQAIVHTHAFAACLLSSLQYDLEPLHYEGALLVPGRLAQYTKHARLITTAALGEDVARTLTDGAAVLLRNHGLITVGGSIEEACMLALHLERACQMQIMALQCNLPRWVMNKEEVQEKRTIYQENRLSNSLWEYYRRQLVE